MAQWLGWCRLFQKVDLRPMEDYGSQVSSAKNSPILPLGQREENFIQLGPEAAGKLGWACCWGHENSWSSATVSSVACVILAVHGKIQNGLLMAKNISAYPLNI